MDNGRLERIEAELSRLSQKIEELSEQITRLTRRYTVVCPTCNVPFDLLANHYSIGLFDNLVYVKCPRCNKPMPLVDESGDVRVVQDSPK